MTLSSFSVEEKREVEQSPEWFSEVSVTRKMLRSSSVEGSWRCVSGRKSRVDPRQCQNQAQYLTFCLAVLQESPPEVFIEGIFQPSYKSGKLHTLENLLESIDPTLESWGKYLIAACQHLQKKNYYHILYELQQFMKVIAPSCPLPLLMAMCHAGRLCKTVIWSPASLSHQS